MRMLARGGHSAGYVAERDRLVARLARSGGWSGQVPLSEGGVELAVLGLCSQHGVVPARALAAIRGVHAENGWPWPVQSGRLELIVRGLEKVRADKQRVLRELGEVLERPRRRPVEAYMLQAWCASAAPGSAESRRDTALLLLGFRALCRAAELRDMRVADVGFEDGGRMVVTKRVHKTDVAGLAPIRIHVDSLPQSHTACPVRAMIAWLAARAVAFRMGGWTDTGFLFVRLDGQRGVAGGAIPVDHVSKCVKAVARNAGLPVEGFSGHCLRIGGATAMMLAGRSDSEIMVVGGWTSEEFRRYLRAERMVADGLTGDMLGLERERLL